ncbi:MAG: histidine kinase [Flavobacteriaceae bacterium]|nr:histidine kinase [Flavobacteriaceae bacterium]
MYLSFSLLLILIFTWLTEKFMPMVLESSFPTYLFISYPSSYAWMGLYATYVLLAILFYMAIDWHQRFQNEKRLLQEHHQLLQGQLQQLRGQIHPLFLFNALNVIYSLQLTKRKETTAAILQLSDILRYVLYQTNRPIPLEEEIALLENYIQFQQFRIQHRVKFEKEIEDPQYLLSPMLILPILENCYKHGFENSLADNELYVYLSQKGNHFECRIRNSKGQSSNAEKKEGIGLANLRQQLEIQYPQGFQLAIKETDHYFEVCLQLNQAIVASS